MVASLFIGAVCLFLLILAVVGIGALLILARQGEGVSNARRGWIEGVEARDDR